MHQNGVKHLNNASFARCVYVHWEKMYHKYAGIYIMQNTMVRGGGGKLGAGEKKLKKGKEKTRKITLKRGKRP